MYNKWEHVTTVNKVVCGDTPFYYDFESERWWWAKAVMSSLSERLWQNWKKDRSNEVKAFTWFASTRSCTGKTLMKGYFVRNWGTFRKLHGLAMSKAREKLKTILSMYCF